MLPRWHVFYGAIVTFILWFFSQKTPVYLFALFFLASFLIDFDHYIASGLKTGNWNLRSSFDYHRKMGKVEKADLKRGNRKRGDFHLFHTVEFHLFVGLMSFIWFGFFYVFAGMIFHSLLDVFSLINRGALHRREYFLSRWIRDRI